MHDQSKNPGTGQDRLISALHGVQNLVDRVLIEWADRRISPFHHVWLRDNCPCAQCVYSVTREQLFEIVDAAPVLAPSTAYIDTDGCLRIDWQDGHLSRFDAGWLRAHAYDEASRAERRAQHPRAACQTFRVMIRNRHSIPDLSGDTSDGSRTGMIKRAGK